MRATSTSPRDRRALDVLRGLATLVFVGFLVWRIDVRSVGAKIANLDARFVALHLALSVPLYLLCAWRWHFTAERLGAGQPFRRAYSDYYLSTLLNQVLPLGVAGDIVRAGRSARGREWKPAALAVILERFSGAVALALFVIASAIVWFFRSGALVPIAIIAGLCVAGALFLMVLRIGSLAGQARVALVDRGAFPFQLGVSIVVVVLLLAMFACAGRAAGISLAPASIVQIVPLVLAAMTIPWAFAGWGAREACTAFLFGLMGKSPEDGVAMSVAFGILNLVAAAPGLVVLCLPRERAR